MNNFYIKFNASYINSEKLGMADIYYLFKTPNCFTVHTKVSIAIDQTALTNKTSPNEVADKPCLKVSLTK